MFMLQSGLKGQLVFAFRSIRVIHFFVSEWASEEQDISSLANKANSA